MCSALPIAFEHRGKDLVAVAEDVDAVALGGRNSDDAFDVPPQFVDAVGHVDGAGRGDEVPGAMPARLALRWSLGCGRPARTASSWAATAAPKSTATDERNAHSSSATMPASGP